MPSPNTPSPQRSILSVPNSIRSSCYLWVMPSSNRCNSLLDLRWAPATWLVAVDRSVGFQDWIDDTPGLFYIVFPGKQSGVSVHRVTEDAFVCIHILCSGITGRQ